MSDSEAGFDPWDEIERLREQLTKANEQADYWRTIALELHEIAKRAETAEAKLRVWEGDLNLKVLSQDELLKIIKSEP